VELPELEFDDKGLVPAIVQDSETLEVLMLAYMNAEALEKTLSEGRVHFFSRSRNSLWLKGETSGNFLDLRSVHYDCDADALVVKVSPAGPACHTGERSCFYRRLDAGLETAGRAGPVRGPGVLRDLYGVIKDRKGSEPEKSYVAGLYRKGLDKILEKVEEESGELVEAAREKGGGEVVHEMTDLWFHTLVLLANQGIEIEEVFDELARRFGTSGLAEKASRKG